VLRRNGNVSGTVTAPPEPAPLPYCRFVYSSLIDWYKVADTKGQLLLTLNGVFITLLSGIILLAPQDLLERKRDFGTWTWTLLATTSLATLISVLCAIVCLHSQLSDANLKKLTKRFSEPQGSARDYRPVVTFWFGTLAQLDRKVSQELLESADGDFEVAALIDEIQLLAPNVLRKHRWTNRGWVAGGVALILLLSCTISVIVDTT
jgi:hypothetical protein